MIKDAVFSSVNRYGMALSGRNVVVCVSGGADSMALLHFLNRYRKELKIESMYACHFNHGIRGEESDRDELFVRRACEELGIELMVGYGRMSEGQRPVGLSEEMWARNLRREFILDCCGKKNAVAAMAHTLNDSVETMLFNIARGSGIRGLRGISPVYQNTLRPFIEISREDIEAYCDANNIAYVTDSTNLSDDYSRNYLRHNVIPQFISVNGAFLDNAKRMMSHVEDAYAYIDARCDELLAKSAVSKGYKSCCFASADPYIARCSVKKILDREFDMIDEKAVSLCLDVALGKVKAVEIRKNSFFTLGENGIFYIENREKAPERITSPCCEIRIGSEVMFGRYKATFSLEEHPINGFYQKSSQKVYNNLIDYDKIKGGFYLRGRREGDKFSSALRGNTKSLKKLFNELAIPAKDRDCYPVLADDSGIIWVMGQGPSASVAADENTKKVLTISLEEVKP